MLTTEQLREIMCVYGNTHPCYLAAAECLANREAQPVAGELGEIRVGRLPTMNQENYPGLGDWWVQLRIGVHNDEILARVYGATPEEAMTRARLLTSPPASAESLPVAWSGWACQYPGHMPRLYGDKAVAEVNCDYDGGMRLLFLSSAPPTPANAAAWEMRYWSDGYNIWGDWERISEGLYTRLSAEHAADNDYEFRVLYDAPSVPAVVKLPTEFYSDEGIVVRLEQVMAALALIGVKYERKGDACRAAILEAGR